MFHENKNFINRNLCDWLIKFHKEYYPRFGMPTDLNNRNCLDLFSSCHFIKLDNEHNDSDPIKYLISKISQHISEIDPTAFINYAQIVHWPTESYQPSHLDFSYHTSTSIIYLNDDFSGGKTVVDDETIQPESGKILTFNGSILKHEVLPVLSGDRYTIAIWYKNFSEL